MRTRNKKQIPSLSCWLWDLPCAHAQSCPTLCTPMDWGLPGCSVYEIFQARILEWVAISFYGGIFPTEGSNLHLLSLLHWQANSLALSHLESGVGSGNPLQYSCLENFMYRGAWWTAVHGVTKSRTWLSSRAHTVHAWEAHKIEYLIHLYFISPMELEKTVPHKQLSILSEEFGTRSNFIEN